eukprot:TRINITY_DN6015_c0_g1_i1.p1 TRINITY_DN6015_c0_g1~~TRINITY_DN6015_c0_g1_i1.p1  ORF type:complete len:213 (-),score=49.04 TRINITY_DN6015_c0_g1_i1:159-797(-)
MSYVSPPTPHSDIRLWTTPAEREQHEIRADIYSIIKTVERLEKAYVRDIVSAENYTKACEKLIAQFKTATHAMPNFDARRFMQEMHMECPAASHRLLVSGVPSTVEHGHETKSDKSSKYIAESVQHFITAMDSLKLGMKAVDQIFPLLKELMECLNSLSNLPQTYDGKEVVKKWLGIMNKMRASDELAEDQVRQLMFDLENAYNGFHRALHK